MKHAALIWLFVFVVFKALSQNPICPPGLNIADPSTHIWKDGRLYVYGSRDESLNYYCSYDYWVLSTSDLQNWEYTPNVFASKGKNDQIDWNDLLLFAPDVMYKDGKYYLYFCQPGKREGVAIGHSPTGPFTQAKPMYLKDKSQIDPAVFIDDDGQAYYLWGQFQAKIAKLKPNMTEIDTTTIVDSLLTEKEHFFHEGVFMRKRNGIYYLVYADMSRKGMPTCIGYATSTSPLGPFKYGGVIVDNDGCDPANWNNHGSIVEFKGQWYVFYHRTTHGVKNMRKACIEPIYFNADGSITEVEMTTQGAGKPLDAFSKIEAERACLLFGNARIEYMTNDPENPLNTTNNDQIGQIANNDWAAFKYIDFKNGAGSITVNATQGIHPTKIMIKVDNLWGAPIATLQIPGEGDGKTFQSFTCNIKPNTGVHALYLIFSTTNDEKMHVDWLQFNSK